MANYIEPRVLKGFRDFLPGAEIIRRGLTEKIEGVFRSFGFVPIDTPALEYADILLGKGGGETEKQIYRFTDNGERDVALRFDLTVPFARYVALHYNELTFPFKRYHIGKVWRGENTQRGRYREFTQCDFDIIGSDSPAADFEILLLIHTTLQNLGIDVNIHVNHRGIFNRFLSHIEQNDKSVEILRTVDKLSKIGEAETKKSLSQLCGEQNAQKILEFIGAKGSFSQVLQQITDLSGGQCPESERLASLHQFMADATGNNADDLFTLAPSITRGLDYYTGVVFETFMKELPDIGSICSGGRYDNLAGLYSKSQETISGVGSSIGLDRLLAGLESLEKLPKPASCTMAIACINTEESGVYQKLAQTFRTRGVSCEVFTEGCGNKNSDKHLVKQFQLAEKKGIKFVLIPKEASKDDATGSFTIRDIAERKNTELSIDEIINLAI